MLVSIVGQASFHTAGPSGPSMSDRSYFLGAGGGTAVGDVAVWAGAEGADTGEG